MERDDHGTLRPEPRGTPASGAAHSASSHPGEARAELPDDGRFVSWLRTGDANVVDVLRARCERVASRQFSAWAWSWVRDDFVADLLVQLSGAVCNPDFVLRGAAGAYVDTAIRNLCRHYFRDVARCRKRVSLDAVQAFPAHGVHDALMQVAAVLDLQQALDALPPECRRMLRDKYVRGEKLAEIGERLGVPAKTVRSRLHTCRQRLRKLLLGESTTHG